MVLDCNFLLTLILEKGGANLRTCFYIEIEREMHQPLFTLITFKVCLVQEK